jgi:hypothetical protein
LLHLGHDSFFTYLEGLVQLRRQSTQKGTDVFIVDLINVFLFLAVRQFPFDNQVGLKILISKRFFWKNDTTRENILEVADFLTKRRLLLGFGSYLSGHQCDIVLNEEISINYLMSLYILIHLINFESFR